MSRLLFFDTHTRLITYFWTAFGVTGSGNVRAWGAGGGSVVVVSFTSGVEATLDLRCEFTLWKKFQKQVS